jgi:hypothetical protein
MNKTRFLKLQSKRFLSLKNKINFFHKNKNYNNVDKMEAKIIDNNAKQKK